MSSEKVNGGYSNWRTRKKIIPRVIYCILLTFCQSRIYLNFQRFLLFQLEMPEVTVMMSFPSATT